MNQSVIKNKKQNHELKRQSLSSLHLTTAGDQHQASCSPEKQTSQKNSKKKKKTHKTWRIRECSVVCDLSLNLTRRTDFPPLTVREMLTEQKIHSERDQLHLTLRGRYLTTLLAFYGYNPAYLFKTLSSTCGCHEVKLFCDFKMYYYWTCSHYFSTQTASTNDHFSCHWVK